MLSAFSPRIMGETFHTAGRAMGSWPVQLPKNPNLALMIALSERYKDPVDIFAEEE